MSTTGLLALFALVALAVIIALIYKRVLLPKISKKLFTCSKCKTHCDYEKDVEWSVIKEYTSQNDNNTKLNTEVRFTIHCPKCGQTASFSKTFATRVINNKTGNVRDYNLEELVKKFYQ